jgi:hypothetical protein
MPEVFFHSISVMNSVPPEGTSLADANEKFKKSFLTAVYRRARMRGLHYISGSGLNRTGSWGFNRANKNKIVIGLCLFHDYCLTANGGEPAFEAALTVQQVKNNDIDNDFHWREDPEAWLAIGK